MTDATPSIFRTDVLEGKVALITGGGTGIGYGISSCLAAAGADVIISSRKPEHLAPAEESLREHGGRVKAIEGDVRDPESVGRLMQQAVREFDRIDISTRRRRHSAPMAGRRSSRPISTARFTVPRPYIPS
jgi:enoyl-[acyl-carrier-protein] reductase (NADH)